MILVSKSSGPYHLISGKSKMDNSRIAIYSKHYSELQFERSKLFEAIVKNYNCTDVLYPGSFVHITPSYCFPHVVYVDQSPIAKDSFDATGTVLAHVNRNKQYKRSAYLQFLHQDFLRELPLAEGGFDLLLSLFTGGVAAACKKYLKIGGILVTNNFHNDAGAAAEDPEFELTSALRYRNKQYAPVERPYQVLMKKKLNAQSRKYIKQSATGIEYIEEETYFIFKRRLVRE
jgi:hypothetical protein